MKSITRSALLLLFLAALLCGAYPAVITLAAQLFFPHQANGSLVRKHGAVVGSELVGQVFTRAEYFHGRPSAAGGGYDGANSSGSNLAPTSRKLIGRIKEDVDRIRRENPTMGRAPVPTEWATASASGLDPHLSPAGIEAQVTRVATARKVARAEAVQLVKQFTEPSQWGLFGETRVNVLLLNIELDRLCPIR